MKKALASWVYRAALQGESALQDLWARWKLSPSSREHSYLIHRIRTSLVLPPQTLKIWHQSSPLCSLLQPKPWCSLHRACLLLRLLCHLEQIHGTEHPGASKGHCHVFPHLSLPTFSPFSFFLPSFPLSLLLPFLLPTFSLPSTNYLLEPNLWPGTISLISKIRLNYIQFKAKSTCPHVETESSFSWILLPTHLRKTKLPRYPDSSSRQSEVRFWAWRQHAPIDKHQQRPTSNLAMHLEWLVKFIPI